MHRLSFDHHLTLPDALDDFKGAFTGIEHEGNVRERMAREDG